MLNPLRDKKEDANGGEGRTPVVTARLVQRVVEGKASHGLS